MVDFNSMFEYRDGKLFNKTNRGSRARKGEEAGSINGRGYMQVGVLGKNYEMHRVIWLMCNGSIAVGKSVDHIDHNKLNNKIENLRLVSHKENHKNRAINIKNKSGVTGVTWHKKAKKWVAHIKANGSPLHLGLFEDLELAELVVLEAREKFGYHPNHGISL